MTNTTYSTTSQTAGLVSYFNALRDEVAARINRSRVYRKTFNELNAMSDRELADIGLSRLQIADIAADTAAQI
ncbi:MAG: hypothetical protein DI533_00125 [Cereibacter sphaeroides]|uniref:YjiS-like domain-containing protein n=1 Tax=Cereibacter sphaeroides TaxID=1063 RepID=A0A2W5SJA4_CERSP|nr:MAG: hypothetical protein DI533_00125 [Cereibacter sphaeroides]